ncbi:hypothetical protein PHYSODRAFT_523000, partial [Phytophthora sojae]
REREGSVASSKLITGGTRYPRAKVRCSTSTTGRIFHAQSMLALGDLLFEKWR